MVSSIYDISKGVVVANFPIVKDTNIFSTPLTIPLDALIPGGGGVLRVWISVITVSNNDTVLKVIRSDPLGSQPLVNLQALFNPENGFKIQSRGLYWFDVAVIPGSVINLVSTSTPDGSTIPGANITAIEFLSFQLVSFGA